MTAADLDAGDNGRLTYTILQGDRHGQFRVDAETGRVGRFFPFLPLKRKV